MAWRSVFGRATALAIGLWVCGAPEARADLISSVMVNTAPSGALEQYTYMLSVDAASGVGASSFFVDVANDASLTSIMAPTGWDISYLPGDPDVEFTSPAASFDIAPGMSGTFSFLSPITPQSAPYLVRGLDANSNLFENTGTTLSAVPEPSGAALMAIGLAGLAGLAARKTSRRGRLGLLGVVATFGIITPIPAARASDHADTAENVRHISADLTDVFIFPSKDDPNNVVFVMDVRGLIPSGQGASVSFDPRTVYQFKVDNSGDHVEDLVIQAKFVGVGQEQKVFIAGPMKPSTIGTTAIFGRRHHGVGTINTIFSPAAGMKVFAGVREDPFFFDLERFFAIFPDRMTPLTGKQVETPNPNGPHLTSWRPPGEAMDFLIGFNVLSIVVEMPRAWLAPEGGKPGVIGLWETTNVATGSGDGFKYQQLDRLARPVVNEALATVTNRRHEVNNKDNPTDDAGQLKLDIESFLKYPAGRSSEIRTVLEAVLVPDVMTADLASADPASYLGIETGGFTGGKFGGRALHDDVVDISLYAVFGTAISDLGLAPPDHHDIPSLTSDHVGPGGKHFLDTFPYLGDPR